MASNGTLVLPNPNTPLAFLEPTLANQFEVSRYLYVAGLSAFVWDWLMSIPEEYKIFRGSKLSVPNVAYFLSRIGTLGYCVTATLFQTASITHCQALLDVIGCFFILAVPSTSLLFVYRVRAVYGKSKIVTGFFGFLWVAILGLSVLVPLAIDGEHIGTTQRCINTAVRGYASAPIVLNAVNDTLIFLAISFKIMSFSLVGTTWQARTRSFVEGKGLPGLSKALLQGGQLYYFATIGMSIVTSAMLLAPGVPAVYHAMFSIPNLALECAMACRVFRAVRIGFIVDGKDVKSSGPLSGIGSSNGLALKDRSPNFDYTEPRNAPLHIEITTTRTRVEDPHKGDLEAEYDRQLVELRRDGLEYA